VVIKVTHGHVLLSFRTTATAVSLCSLQDDGATHHHHTSVSCSSSKVCSIGYELGYYSQYIVYVVIKLLLLNVLLSVGNVTS